MNPNARTWSELSAFKRDAVVAVLRRGGLPDSDPDDRPYGLGIKRELEILRGDEVNHGRLYPNLDDLVDDGIIVKGKHDERTNRYHVTDVGVNAYQEYLVNYVGIGPAADGVDDAARGAYDRQTSQERGDA